MKLLVDSLPENPRDCLFSYYNCEVGWFCKFGSRTCKLVKKLDCDCLIKAESYEPPEEK